MATSVFFVLARKIRLTKPRQRGLLSYMAYQVLP